MVFKVVRGNPTPEELAAVLVVVHACVTAAAAVPAAAPRRLDGWAGKARNTPHRDLPQPGPMTWRSSYRPR